MENCVYVRPSDKEQRIELVEYLEAHGFKCEENYVTSKQSTIESRFPLTIDVTHKLYGHLHNTTCAAGVVSSKRLISAEEFLTLYKDLVK